MKLTDQLLLAAEKLFIDKGFEATTIEDICAVAKHSRPTFYKRFKDKHDLFKYYVAAKAKMLIEHLQQIPGVIVDEKSFAQQSYKYLNYMYGKDVLTFHRLVAGAASHHPEIQQIFRTELVAKHIQLRQQVVTQLIMAGLIKPTKNISELAKLLGSLITADSYYLTVTGGQDPLTGNDLKKFTQERSSLFLKIANQYI